ncbi:MAG: SDR family oxidoreductase [Candidatus Kapabacteria bacterium]|nr:SDR family oxidoreductase [Candidatus Kapabacteria bacterium]
MEKKVCLLTGATAGIGKEAAAMIAEDNFKLVFTARNKERAENTKKYIIEQSGNEDIDYFFCDLASLNSIKSFTKEFKEKYDKIDVLINNAGTWESKLNYTEDGYERTFAVNHLAHFYLTHLLLDLLAKSNSARIINVASAAHKYARFNFDDPDSSKKFDFLKVYANSKLANIWFTNVLAEKLKDKNITVNSLMPGVIVSELLRSLPFPIKQLTKLISKPTTYGAKTIVRLALSEEVQGITGTYFDEFKVGKLSKEAQNFEKAQKFWELSERMISSKIPDFQSI